MATKKSQRIGIIIIAVVMLVGTLGSFAVIILSTQNASVDQARMEKLQSEYQAEYAEFEQKQAEQADELSNKYYDQFSPYQERVGEFDGAAVTELRTEDLKVGEGEKINQDTEYSAYYIGWRPDGEVFDSSIDGDKLKAPIAGGNLIEGWNKGVEGMKIGGVRELTIPAELAYGETGAGEDIPPNTPIKFVVMAIESPETIDPPEPSQELIDFYSRQQG